MFQDSTHLINLLIQDSKHCRKLEENMAKTNLNENSLIKYNLNPMDASIACSQDIVSTISKRQDNIIFLTTTVNLVSQ